MSSLTSLSFASPIVTSETRGRLTLPAAAVAAAQSRLQAAGLHVFLLFTCLRIEIAWCGQPEQAGPILDFIYGEGIRPDLATLRRDEDAFLHLCRVAAGLDSPLTGEREVLAQFRRAVADCNGTGGSPDRLNRVLEQSVGVARAARRQLGEEPGGSLAAVAAAEAARFERVAIFGSGAMARAAVQLLTGPEVSVFARRRTSVAGHETLEWDRAVRALADFPAIISTIPGKTPLFPSGVAARTLARRNEPLLLIDMGMPPGFDVADHGSLVHYMGVDDVASAVDVRPAVAAEEAIRGAASAAWLRLAAEDRVGRVIAAIVGHADRAVGEEVQRFARKLPNGGDHEAVLAQLAHTVARRILHPTIAYVGSSERGGEAAELFAEAFGVADE